MGILVSAAKFGLAFVVLATLGACALTRSEIAVAQDVPSNPASGVVVALVSVADERQFEAASTEISTPTLKEPSQISDKQITSRALGRKRNTFGAAMGDVLLAPPQTVAGLVGDAVKSGLRDAGYRVLDGSDPASTGAPRINVRVVRFWTWVATGRTINLEHHTNIILEGNLPRLREPAVIGVQGTEGYFAISESAWAPFLRQRLNELRQKVRDAVAPRTS